MNKNVIIFLIALFMTILVGCNGEQVAKNKAKSQVNNEIKNSNNISNSKNQLFIKQETKNSEFFMEANLYTITDNKSELQYLTLTSSDGSPMTLRIDKNGKPYTKNTHSNFKLDKIMPEGDSYVREIYIVKDLDTGVEYIAVRDGEIKPRLNKQGLPYTEP